MIVLNDCKLYNKFFKYCFCEFFFCYLILFVSSFMFYLFIINNYVNKDNNILGKKIKKKKMCVNFVIVYTVKIFSVVFVLLERFFLKLKFIKIF